MSFYQWQAIELTACLVIVGLAVLVLCVQLNKLVKAVKDVEKIVEAMYEDMPRW